jgi:predicted lipid-binding transport protein (Tim44 family)
MQATPSGSRRSELDDRPIGDLVKELSEQTSTLVRKELALARAEMTQKGKTAGIGAGMFGGAVLMGALALGALTAFLILALSIVLDEWLAALVVALLYGTIAGALALIGKGKVKEATPPVPEQTKASVRRDIEETKARAKAARS